MIQKVEMFTIVCDNCQLDIGTDSDYSCWGDDGYAEDNAMESYWEKQDDKHYCPNCYSYDDKDNFILDSSRKDKYKVKLPD